MDHDKLVETLRTVIENKQDPDVSRWPDDYDLEAIVAEVQEVIEGADADGLDPEEYWQIVERHVRP